MERGTRVSTASDNEQRPQERRRWPRTHVNGDIVGWIYTPTVAPVLDLSEAGALLEVPCLLRAHTIYALRLAVGRDAVLLLRATVLRSYADHLEQVSSAETRARFHAALQFIDPSPREKELLRLRIAGPESGAAPPRDTPATERRDALRIGFEGEVEGEVGLRVGASVRMLSQGGLLLEMPFAPQIGVLVNCSFGIDGQSVQVDAIVRHTHQQSIDVVNPPHSVGLELLGQSGPARAAIEAYVARRLKAASA